MYRMSLPQSRVVPWTEAGDPFIWQHCPGVHQILASATGCTDTWLVIKFLSSKSVVEVLDELLVIVMKLRVSRSTFWEPLPFDDKL